MSTHNDPFLNEPTAKIMLLDTFHFQDAGLDAYKPQVNVDILSEQRQQEIVEIVEQLAQFRPTKIAIERRPDRQEEIDQSYRAYLRGEFQLPGSEAYQLGFRLAKRLNHHQLYCVDAWGRYYDPPLDLEAYGAGRTTQELQQFLAEEFDFDPHRDLAVYAHGHDQDPFLSQWAPRIQRWLEHGDQAKTQRTLLENLLLINAEENLLKSHGTYLVDWFKVGTNNEYPGVDVVTGWYNRNLRIFANLQRITEAPDERILLIIGAGHVPILCHCVQASLEYTLVEVYEYLTPGRLTLPQLEGS